MIKLFKYLKKYRLLLLLILCTIIIQTFSDLQVPDLLSTMINTGLKTKSIQDIVGVALQMFGFVIVASVAAMATSYIAAYISSNFVRDIRKDLYKRVNMFSNEEMNQLNTSSLITRITNDLFQIQQVMFMTLRLALAAPIIAVGGFFKALEINPYAASIFAVSVPTLVFIIVVVNQVSMPIFMKAQKKLDQLNLVVSERLGGVRVIRAYNRDHYESLRFEGVNEELIKTNKKVNRLMALTMPMFRLLLDLTIMAIVWLGAHQVQLGAMQLGDITALLQYTMQVLFAFMNMAMIFIQLPRAMASAKRVNEVFNMELTINDPVNPVETFDAYGSIEFKDVAFSFKGAKRPVLEDISFVMKPGEVTAIIGGTGSGKSTIVNLISRFYECSHGEVLIDQVNVKDMRQETLRSKIGFVPQKITLFSGTIASNLRFGKPDATIEDMIEATTIAQATSFIQEKENGFNSIVEHGGVNFSGGQRQRLAIARALIRKPEIYIFDDSFSALDYKTDALLREALSKKLNDSSMLVVGQRISSIMNANQIIVLDKGRIVGKGTHRELMNSCKVYQEIAQSQLSEEELS